MHNYRSFTIIELLIILAIIGLFSGYALATYNSFTQEKKLDNEAKKIVDILDLAKRKAASSDINYDCTPPDVFDGYRVTITSPSSYNIRQCCQTALCSTSPIIQSFSLPNNVSFTSGSTTIDFYPMTRGVNAATTIKIKNTSLTPNKCLDISVSTTGTITTSDKSYATGC